MISGAGRTTRLILAVASLALSAQGADTVVGSVKTAQGLTTARRGAENIPVREGTHLLLNDTLQTGADGSLGVILQDGTRVSLGPNSELKIDRFVYEPADGKFSLLLQLARGAMAYISGRIAQFSPQSVSVETPVGVLGLRGTRFAMSLDAN
jgi:hypothetical protein